MGVRAVANAASAVKVGAVVNGRVGRACVRVGRVGIGKADGRLTARVASCYVNDFRVLTHVSMLSRFPLIFFLLFSIFLLQFILCCLVRNRERNFFFNKKRDIVNVKNKLTKIKMS